MSSSSIDELLRRRRLEAVSADPEAARLMLDEAKLHLTSAAQIAALDPNGGYQLLYDAARKAVAAHMLARGLRATNRAGAHDAVVRYARSELAAAGEAVRQLDRIRRSRNRSEYDVVFFEQSVVENDLEHATRIVAVVELELR